MPKANQRSLSFKGTHAVEGEFKIPIEHRKKFMGHRNSKWVGKKKYLQYIHWRKRMGYVP